MTLGTVSFKFHTLKDLIYSLNSWLVTFLDELNHLKKSLFFNAELRPSPNEESRHCEEYAKES